jgi:CBS domain containing-hemolysin-like protein
MIILDIVPILMQLLLVLFLIFMNGFFVAGEFCVVKIRPSRLEMLIEEGNKQAAYAKKLSDHLDTSLSVTQLGITLASLGLGWVGEPAVAAIIVPIVHLLGFSDIVGHTISFTLAFAIITSAHIVLGELTPKSMAIMDYESIMLKIALPMLIFERVTYPVVWFLNSLANFIARHLGFEAGNGGEEAHSEEEIRLLMEQSHEQGLIDDTEADFVDNVFDFTGLNVREIMTPRTDMVCLYLEDSLEKSLATIFREQLTRYPICREDKDHVVGFLHVKDLMKALYLQPGRRLNLRRLARKALVVPDSMDVSVLLKTMQGSRSQMAIVVDEYGGTAGMVTLEDIVEEIVGDIQDEFDEERPTVEKCEDRLYSVDAKMLLEELEDILEIDIDDVDVDSVGGWLYDQIGQTPRVGQMAAYRGNLFYVEEVDGVRITRVLIRASEELREEHDEIVDMED